MQTNQNQTTVVKNEFPNVDVRLTNMVLDVSYRKVSFNLETRKTGNKKWSKPQPIEAFATKEVLEFFTQLSDDKVQVVADNEKGYEWIPTGNKSTGFQRLLRMRGVEYTPGILQETIFESANDSQDRSLNPFRLFINEITGTNTLSMVNVPAKTRMETIDPNTGEIVVSYKQRYGQMPDGRWTKVFYKKDAYRRLVVRKQEAVEVYQPAN